MACGENQTRQQNMKAADTTHSDPHSCAYRSSARVVSEHLELKIDFSRKAIEGIAEIQFSNPEKADSLFLDVRNLTIRSVENETGEALEYVLGKEKEILGQALAIRLPSDEKEKILIRYQTKPDAAALQWLEPTLTAGKKYPMLFTQGQAILSRTWFPCQDSPGIRFKWSAEVFPPAGLKAVMSADFWSENKNSFSFTMDKPVPAYLVALSVGNLSFKAIGERCGIYSEPEMLEKAAWEFADVEKMLKAAEALYGPYQWGRYDLLLLPPSFPFGGMENPCLTFATPTILAGDRSLVSLVAHELAHSWSGNLVTNATWDDFWLNEGFTVYFERRIMEALEGKEYADMLAVIGWGDLQATLADLGNNSADTKLKLNLKGRDADEGMTDIAYEKGYRLLCFLEEKAGRQDWDAFLKKYFQDHAFSSVTTEEFIQYLNANLLKKKGIKPEDLKLNDWIYQPGLPANCLVPASERFGKAEMLAIQSLKGNLPGFPEVKNWTSHEWLHYLRQLEKDASPELMEKLDKRFAISQSRNAEIIFEWLYISMKINYSPAFEKAEEFLVNTGRRKFVLPLYRELCRRPEGKDLAIRIFARASAGYHPVTRQSVEKVLQVENQH